MKAILVVFFLTANISFAGEGWQADIRVRALNAENRLTIGQTADAADGIEGRYDVPALLSGDIAAYTELEGGKYWRDIKTNCKQCTKTWDIVIESRLSDEVITINWNKTGLPSDARITLVDTVSGVRADMRNMSEYAYINSGKRRFTITVIR